MDHLRIYMAGKAKLFKIDWCFEYNNPITAFLYIYKKRNPDPTGNDCLQYEEKNDYL